MVWVFSSQKMPPYHRCYSNLALINNFSLTVVSKYPKKVSLVSKFIKNLFGQKERNTFIGWD